jgi:UDP-glucose 4-epimerase
LPRALVTGGCGFIGSGIAEELTRRGWSVVSLDIAAPSPGTGEVIQYELGDVRDRPLVDRLVAGADLVFHLAAVVGVDRYIQQPEGVLEVNIGGSRNVLDACRRHGRPVVQASSSEVYGRNQAVLHEEADKVYGNLTNVRWVYALSKAVGEEYAQAMAGAGLRFISVRYFNVYGPNMDSVGQGRVIAKFLGFIRDAQPLVLVDGGHAVRSFCYIDDAVEATMRLGLLLHEGDARVNQPVNIGRREPLSMKDLAYRMIDLSGHKAGVREISGESFFGAGFEEIPSRIPDVTRLRELTGFEAKIGLNDGLRRTLALWDLLAPGEKLRLMR